MISILSTTWKPGILHRITNPMTTKTYKSIFAGEKKDTQGSEKKKSQWKAVPRFEPWPQTLSPWKRNAEPLFGRLLRQGGSVVM